MKAVRATPAPAPKTGNIRGVSLLLAAILIVLVVGQLFTFEDFPDLVASFWLPGDGVTAKLVAALLVTTEVFALPFLLRMRLSPLMRVVSMACGWLAIAGWLFISLWINVVHTGAINAGLLGATIPLPVGWWAVSFMAALGVLAAWVSWGMWPLGRVKK